MKTRRSLAALALISAGLCSVVLGESSRTAQQATQDGNRLLAEGEYSGAARAYGAAIGGSGLMYMLTMRAGSAIIFELL
jgi:DMSO reductase anchor subunit